MIQNNEDFIQAKQKATSQDIQSQIEACYLELQQNIDISFNKIDNFLDSIIDDTLNTFNQNFLISEQSTTIQYNISQPSFQIPDFANQMVHQIVPLVKALIENQIKKKKEFLTQDFIQQEQLNPNFEQDLFQNQQLEIQDQDILELKQTQTLVQQSIELDDNLQQVDPNNLEFMYQQANTLQN